MKSALGCVLCFSLIFADDVSTPHKASVETALGSLLHVNNAALSYSYGEACVFIVYGFE